MNALFFGSNKVMEVKFTQAVLRRRPNRGRNTSCPDALEDAINEMNGLARTALQRGWEQWRALDQQIAWYDAQIALQARQSPRAHQLMLLLQIAISANGAH
ncbi:hypothetical protein ACU4HD_31980 [Cupriavidus basilensis]